MQGQLNVDGLITIAPGQEIKVPYSYTATAPGQGATPAWTVAVVAYLVNDPTYAIQAEDNTTHLTEGPVSGSSKLDFNRVMGKENLYLQIVLWGNPDAWKTFPYDGGNWQELDSKWMVVQSLVEETPSSGGSGESGGTTPSNGSGTPSQATKMPAWAWGAVAVGGILIAAAASHRAK